MSQSGIDDVDSILAGGVDTTHKGAKEKSLTHPTGDYEDRAGQISGLPGVKETPINTKWGEGKLVTLPDGTIITVRPGSSEKSGGGPTIDINSPERGIEKHRFKDDDKREEKDDD